VFAGCLAYSNSFSGPFIFDDKYTITERIPTLFSEEHPWRLMAEDDRPLMSVINGAQYAVFGLQIWSYHAVNLLIHLLAGLTLYGFLRRTFLTPRLRDRFGASAHVLAFVITLLWLLHPLQTQSVTYISQRAESLAGLFSFLTFYALVRSSEGSRGRMWCELAVLFSALGLAVKETTVVVPFLCFVYDRIFLSQSLRGLVRKRWGMYLGMALMGIFLVKRIEKVLGLGFDVASEGIFMHTHAVGLLVDSATPLQYALSQPGVILHYLSLALWPGPLCFDYLWPVASTMVEILPGCLVIGSLLILTIIALIRKPPLGFIGVWFFIQLAPRSSIVPIADLAVEHRMYLPVLSVIALGVFGWLALTRFLERRGSMSSTFNVRLSWALFVVIALALGARTFVRNFDYRTEISIWRDTIEKRPSNSSALNNFGAALMNEGRLEEAIGYVRKAHEINPRDGIVYSNLAAYLVSQEARKASPDRKKLFTNIGAAQIHRAKLHKGIAKLEEVLTLDPNYEKALYNVGVAHLRRREPATATAYFERVLEQNPDHFKALNNLGALRFSEGAYGQAVELYERALDLEPDHPEIVRNLRMAQARKTKEGAGLTQT
jgi:protein O-mannosyl-transferase